MDLSRTKALEDAIRDAIQIRTRYLCLYEDDGHEIFYGRTLNIGLDWCAFRMRAVRDTGRHNLIVQTLNTKPRVFKETSQGWFMIEHVADYAVHIVGEEAERRGEAARGRQRLNSVWGQIKRQSGGTKGLPPMELNPNGKDPSLFDLTVRGVTERQVTKVLDELRLDLNPNTKVMDIWKHLHEEDSG
jgi:hypothetical protein